MTPGNIRVFTCSAKTAKRKFFEKTLQKHLVNNKNRCNQLGETIGQQWERIKDSDDLDFICHIIGKTEALCICAMCFVPKKVVLKIGTRISTIQLCFSCVDEIYKYREYRSDEFER